MDAQTIGVDKLSRHPHGGCEVRGCSPSRASPSKIGPDRGKITAILGLGGGQNLLLVVLFVNTNNGKQQQNTVVSGKRGKRQVATNAFKKVKIVSE